MTAPGKSLVERAIAGEIKRLERELAEEVVKWNQQMVAKAAEGNNLEGYRELGAKLAAVEARAEAAESELARLKAPLEGATVSAEEISCVRAYIARPELDRPEEFDRVVERMADDLDAATAQARSAEEQTKMLAELVDIEAARAAKAADAARAFDPSDEFVRPENYEEVLYSQDFIDAMSALTERRAYTKQACAMLIAEQSIRARRKGETGNG